MVEPEVTLRPVRILVTLVLVVALGAYLYLYEMPAYRREGKKAKLLPIEKDKVSAIALTFPDRKIRLERRDGHWQLVEPIKARADDAAVKSLIGSIANARVERTLEELPKDLKPFGLSPPKPIVRLTLADGTELPALQVGGTTKVGIKTYVRKDDEPRIYLTTTGLGTLLDKQPKDLRDKTLIAFDNDDVVRIAIRGPRKHITLAREDSGWKLVEGGQRADATEVRAYLASLKGLRALDFPDDSPTDLAPYGLDKPRLEVTVTLRGKKGNRSVALGSEIKKGTQKRIYARRGDRPTVYSLGEWALRSLDKSVNDFRDKTVLVFDESKAARIEVHRRDGAGFTLVREKGKWRVEGAPAHAKFKTAAIDGFVDDLHDLRGYEIAADNPSDLSPYGLDGPDYRVTIYAEDGSEIGTIIAARYQPPGKSGHENYMMQEGGSTVFRARDYMIDRLDHHAGDFIEREADKKS